MLKNTSGMQYNFNLEQTWTNMIPKWQIKSLSMANDPITTRLSQEADVLIEIKENWSQNKSDNKWEYKKSLRCLTIVY